MAGIRKMLPLAAAGILAYATGGSTTAHATFYAQTNLVSNGFVPATTLDPQLQAPWGISFTPTGPFWVSDNNDNLSTLYNTAGSKLGLVVSVDSPTGQVSNSDTAGFNIGASGPAKFIFAGSDGTVSAWNGAAPSVGGISPSSVVFTGPAGASYTGLTQGSVGNSTYLYAANSGTNPGVLVLDSNFHPVTLAGNFTDPSLPAGYVPFNTQILNGKLYVAYSNFSTNTGAVAEFDLSGHFIQQVAIGGPLQQPWALDIAPAQFGQYSNDLLVGDLLNGMIDAYDPTTSDFLGQLDGTDGQPITDVGLWALINGNGGTGGSPNSVYFDAEGPSGVDGVFGSLTAVPEPGSMLLFATGLLSLVMIHRRTSRG
jgi:uncharacterized protein (TIGR03118 family)